MKDWTGNRNSAHAIEGVRYGYRDNPDREENDYYATDPIAVNKLLDSGVTLAPNLWECACGEGHLAKRLIEHGYNVLSTDKVDRGYGEIEDFLLSERKFDGDIITNPPYRWAKEFVEHGLELIPPQNSVWMFLKLTFLESKARKPLFDSGVLRCVYVFTRRINCAKNGNFDALLGTPVTYAWFQFSKGGTNEPPIIKWI